MKPKKHHKYECDLINFDTKNYKCPNCGELINKGDFLNKLCPDLDKEMIVYVLFWLMKNKYSYEEMLGMLADAESWL